MIAINASLCSKEFNRAFEAVTKEGKAIRRASWPAGVHLEYTVKRSIYVVRPGSEMFPTWVGPSNDEMDATDWEVISEPAKHTQVAVLHQHIDNGGYTFSVKDEEGIVTLAVEQSFFGYATSTTQLHCMNAKRLRELATMLNVAADAIDAPD